jgi:hypothetical protein
MVQIILKDTFVYYLILKCSARIPIKIHFTFVSINCSVSPGRLNLLTYQSVGNVHTCTLTFRLIQNSLNSFVLLCASIEIIWSHKACTDSYIN